MDHFSRGALLAATALALAASAAASQEVERVAERLLQEVMPQADRFAPAEGDPPVKRAYRGDELLGYVFLTSDLPPQETGYSGPIDALVGVTSEGTLTGVRVTQYRESLRYEWGDFLSQPGFLAQFVGKRVTDAFGIRYDIDGISGATISARALARDVRDSARRVALLYAPPPEQPLATLSEEELVTLSWYEIRRRGAAVTMSVRQQRREPFDVWLIHRSSEGLARHLVGERYDHLAESIEEAGGADEAIFYVVEGGGFVPSLRTGWAVEQGGRRVELPRERVVDIGRPEGALVGESSQVGALLFGDGEVDMTAPLTISFDRGRPEMGTSRVDYTSRAALVLMAGGSTAAEAEAEPEAVVAAAPSSDGAPAVAPPEEAVGRAPPGAATPLPERSDAPPEAASAVRPAGPAPASTRADSAGPEAARQLSQPEPSGPRAAPPQAVPVAPARSGSAQPERAQRELARAGEADRADGRDGLPWRDVGWTLLVIGLACLAFFTKRTALRWVSLAATMVFLGWVDGGFLSISHVTGLVWVGFSAITSDASLLVMALFTVATVLLWGRVFCGYLCPFGALQDFVDRLVPRHLKRELPLRAHRVAWKAKYLILAVILGAAMGGVEVSLYQYVEPFGTVFFVSSSVLLWSIAVVILAASALIPRFYCRYVCPLGALLAVGSLVALRRIPRVEQCEHCRVCEQRCPTRAISGPAIGFAECVRCNVCEVQLLERRGVCRHEMEEIRPRLVQIEGRRAARVGRPVG